MKEAEFLVEVTEGDARRFAELSGDWNPLHTDAAYAATSAYRRPILHGAFSAGLVSRMAGMHLPGQDCLLHGIKLRFTAPIFPPAKLRVLGRITRETADAGTAEVSVTDATSGMLHVEASYEFGHHDHGVPSPQGTKKAAGAGGKILVTGASGGLGRALLAGLGSDGLAVSRSGSEGALAAPDPFLLPDLLGGRPLDAIIHCGWPQPDNRRLSDLGRNARVSVNHHVAEPLSEIVALAQLLATSGTKDSALVLIGSSFAGPGRHGWRMPLYSLAKGMVPTLVEILAMELGGRGKRCVGLVFDVIAGTGMNATMRDAVRLAHADRSPFGELASMDEAAAQIKWVLDNRSRLVSGAVITLSGGALP